MKAAEKLLINKVLKGDVSSFSYFVDTYQDMAFTVAFRICRNRQDAEDIVQNAFVKAFHNLHSFQFTSKFSTWFYRIVYNTAITEMQLSFFKTDFTEYEQTSSGNIFSEWDVITKVEAEERKGLVNEILDNMPSEEALILTLFYLEENSIKDVALMIGLSEANVKVRLHRSRKRFAEQMKAMSLESSLRN